jgi:hypothetical protein
MCKNNLCILRGESLFQKKQAFQGVKGGYVHFKGLGTVALIDKNAPQKFEILIIQVMLKFRFISL